MINSFTLSQLIEMSGDNRQGLMRECFTASSDNRMEIFRFPCRIDAFVIGVGTEGETSVSLNLHEYRLKKIRSSSSARRISSRSSRRSISRPT